MCNISWLIVSRTLREKIKSTCRDCKDVSSDQASSTLTVISIDRTEVSCDRDRGNVYFD